MKTAIEKIGERRGTVQLHVPGLSLLYSFRAGPQLTERLPLWQKSDRAIELLCSFHIGKNGVVFASL